MRSFILYTDRFIRKWTALLVALSHCFTQLHSLKAVADDSTLALSYRSRPLSYESVCR